MTGQVFAIGDALVLQSRAADVMACVGEIAMRMLGSCVLALLLWCPGAGAACPPAGHDAATLRELKAHEFAVADQGERQRRALGLLDCLSDPDPALRDGIAYEALSTWMRGGQLADPTLAELLDRLLPMLSAEDTAGFRRPFAALVLSEVARTDRLQPWLSATERARLVAATADYLAGVRDHRGFVDGEGWRHGVAHASDAVLQLALNPALDATQLDRLRDAVAVQVAPADGHAYIHGEPLRLARSILFIARRGTHDGGEWERWLQRIAAPAPLPDWNAAFSSESGLARRHNVVAFLSALYLLASEQDHVPTRDRLLPGLREALRKIP